MAIDLDADDILTEYLPVALIRDPDGNRVVTDAMINAQIRDARAIAERVLDVRLSPTRFACEPQIVRPGGAPLVKGDDYDALVSRHPWVRGQAPYNMGRSIQLAHPHVLSVTRVRGIVGSTVVYDFPVRWVGLQHLTGVLEWVVDSGPPASISDGEDMIAFFAWLGWQPWSNQGRTLPDFFAVDYVAGLDPDTTGDLPLDDIRAWIAWNAIAAVLAIAQAVLDPEGVTNQSESLDGVSRSYGVDVGKPGGRYARFLDAMGVKKWLGEDVLLKVIKPMVHPLRMF